MNAFSLDSRLAADSFFLGRFTLCEVRAMNDSRWPWLVLVPRIAGLTELHDLAMADLSMAAGEWAAAGRALKLATGALKVNSGALGNVVRQLHLHAVARKEGDPGWPGPVWGHGERRPYDEASRKRFCDTLTRALRNEGMIHG